MVSTTGSFNARATGSDQPAGRMAPSSRSKCRVRGSASEIKPSVAAKESRKPRSHNVFGSHIVMSSAVARRALDEAFCLPKCSPQTAIAPITAARTTAADAPTKTV